MAEVKARRQVEDDLVPTDVASEDRCHLATKPAQKVAADRPLRLQPGDRGSEPLRGRRLVSVDEVLGLDRRPSPPRVAAHPLRVAAVFDA